MGRNCCRSRGRCKQSLLTIGRRLQTAGNFSQPAAKFRDPLQPADNLSQASGSGNFSGA
jgi:hypothetical protein